MNAPSPPFVPPAWLRNGHLQTIAGSYFRSTTPDAKSMSYRIPLEDGDQLVLHADAPATESSVPRARADASESNDTAPAIWRAALLVHGLTGCYSSPYMCRTADKLRRRGVCVFRLDMRGAGASARYSRGSNHAGRSLDILAATEHICRMCPQAQVTLVGFSLGAAMVLRMLGSHAQQIPPQVDGAIAISPPIDLACCAATIQRGLNRMYDRTLCRWMYRQVQQRRALVDTIAELDARGRPPRSIRDFDAQFTAPLGGFASVDHYYASAAAGPVLSQIRLPVRILAAEDDPVVPVHVFRDVSLAALTRLWVTPHGGHLGYYGRKSSDPDRWWLDWRIVDFVLKQKVPALVGSPVEQRYHKQL